MKIILYLSLLFILTHCSQNKELEENEQTITLQFIAWACDCPQWSRPEDTHHFERDDFDCFDHNICIEIEPANKEVEIDSKLWTKENSTRTFEFKGRFYKELKKVKGHDQYNLMRVFRYTEYEYLE